jgi:hypothetical protein
MSVFRAVIPPVLGAGVLFLFIVAYAVRHPAPPPAGPNAAPGRAVICLVATTVGGGFLVFLAIVQIFHVWIARQSGALRSALTGGGFLAFGVVAPSFLLVSGLVSWIGDRFRRGRTS